MLPKKHLVYGFLFSLIIYLLLPQITYFGFFTILLSTVLIDVDHYFYYVYRKKDWNLKNAFNWYIAIGKKYKKFSPSQKKRAYSGLCFLHGIEAIIILAILSYFSIFFFYILLGFLFHQILDAYDLYKRNYSFGKIISFTYSIYQSNLKKHIEEI